uniref:Uncharacterized protein n=1 Tax=Anopheles dirus TaxID=7168 RepID=A0A182NX17_9DIPT
MARRTGDHHRVGADLWVRHYDRRHWWAVHWAVAVPQLGCLTVNSSSYIVRRVVV